VPLAAPARGPLAGAYPGVPVIPEADSVFLVVGGLVACAALIGIRRLRRSDD
jgi:hypothetical protein